MPGVAALVCGLAAGGCSFQLHSLLAEDEADGGTISPETLNRIRAIVGQILVLVFIILFIQRRPRGLFALKGRMAEG